MKSSFVSCRTLRGFYPGKKYDFWIFWTCPCSKSEHFLKFDYFSREGSIGLLNNSFFIAMFTKNEKELFCFFFFSFFSFFPGKFDFWVIWGFFGHYKNARAEISRRTHRRMSRDLSYETDSGPKTKTVQSGDLCNVYCILYICRKSFDSIDS